MAKPNIFDISGFDVFGQQRSNYEPGMSDLSDYGTVSLLPTKMKFRYNSVFSALGLVAAARFLFFNVAELVPTKKKKYLTKMVSDHILSIY